MGIILQEETGQGMVEYSLILALVSIAAVAALLTLGKKVSTKFTEIDGHLDSK